MTNHSVTSESVERAIVDLAAGKAIVVIDHRGQGSVVFAAALATPALVSSVAVHTEGMLGVAVLASACTRLNLAPIRPVNQGGDVDEVMVPVAARGGAGLASVGRARTIRLLADPATSPDELARPGSVFVFRVHAEGVLARPRLLEAAFDLVRLAGLGDGAVVSGVADDEGPIAGSERLGEFADRQGLVLTSVDALIAHRRCRERHMRRAARSRMPLPPGEFTAIAYAHDITEREVLALVHGEVEGRRVLLKVHRECPVGDVFGGACDCRARLNADLRAIAAARSGVLVYLRGGARHWDCVRTGTDDLDDRSDVTDVLADLRVQPFGGRRA